MLSPIDVSPPILYNIYVSFVPKAIDIDCTLVVDDDGNEYDISTLALSIEGQIRNNNNDNDNDKRDLILRGSDFYKQQCNIINTTAAITTTTLPTTDETTDIVKVLVQEQLPPPDKLAIETALRTVANYGEWQAVQNILPLLTYSDSNSNKDDEDEKDDENENNKKKEQQSELEQPAEPLWVTEIRNEMEDYYKKKKRIKEMDRKRRKYFGVVMYDVDIIVDLISMVIPIRRKRNRNNNKRNNQNNKKNNSRSHALDQRRRNDHGGKMM